jgi:hypothetical protein
MGQSQHEPPSSGRARARWIAPALGLWVAMVAWGGRALWSFSTAPGAAATPPATWPAGSTIRRAPGLATIVMLAHPRCSCTRASLTELSKLMTSVAGRAEAHVLFMEPAEEGDSWVKTDLYTQAEAVVGAHVHVDRDGREAARFAARTSGQTVVYDASGQLVFSGGITAFRGHPGDNAGRTRIATWLTQGRADSDTSLVFGCPLTDPQ